MVIEYDTGPTEYKATEFTRINSTELRTRTKRRQTIDRHTTRPDHARGCRLGVQDRRGTGSRHLRRQTASQRQEDPPGVRQDRLGHRNGRYQGNENENEDGSSASEHAEFPSTPGNSGQLQLVQGVATLKSTQDPGERPCDGPGVRRHRRSRRPDHPHDPGAVPAETYVTVEVSADPDSAPAGAENADPGTVGIVEIEVPGDENPPAGTGRRTAPETAEPQPPARAGGSPTGTGRRTGPDTPEPKPSRPAGGTAAGAGNGTDPEAGWSEPPAPRALRNPNLNKPHSGRPQGLRRLEPVGRERRRPRSGRDGRGDRARGAAERRVERQRQEIGPRTRRVKCSSSTRPVPGHSS